MLKAQLLVRVWAQMKGLNLGSGQRRFSGVPCVIDWINADIICRVDQVPDCIIDSKGLPSNWEAVFDYVVLWHVIEHEGCGEADWLLKESYRCLKPGGQLIIAVPDLKALAQRWLMDKIDDYIFAVNVYGAFQGEESDRHRWMYTHATLLDTLEKCGKWERIEYRMEPPPGSDLMADWWMLVATGVKA